MSNNKEQEVNSKTNINWYPGHMAKTRRQITEDLRIVDIVIKNKKKIIILNKSDLADEKQNKEWIAEFKKQKIEAVLTDSNTGRGIDEAIKTIEKIMEKELNLYAEKGRIGKKIKAMVLGIPNVGKSSFINRISKKASAGVGNKPGVTRQKQWIRVNEKIELLDTPGVLWPKFESEEVALNLAFTGTIKDDILERTEIAYYLVKFLTENYKDKLCERYKLDVDQADKILSNKDQPENERGCIISGGNIDEEKTARIILDEFKNGKIGKITLENVKGIITK